MLGKDVFQLLTPILESNTNLLDMELINCLSDPEGMHSLMAPCTRQGMPLNILDISWSKIDDDFVEELVMKIMMTQPCCYQMTWLVIQGW